MGFLKKFQRYNDKVPMAFTQIFNGRVLEVRILKFNVTKMSINKTARLPLTSEK